MTTKPVNQLSLDEIQAHARQVDADAAAARENERLERLGVKPVKREWTQADIDATAQRAAEAEERKRKAAELPDARGLSDAEYEAALARQGIYFAKGLM